MNIFGCRRCTMQNMKCRGKLVSDVQTRVTILTLTGKNDHT